MRALAKPARAAVALAAASLLLGACSSQAADPVQPAKVQLKSGDLPDQVHIGVVVTLRSAPGQGSEWADAASGAQVAAYQYKMGGHHVVLDVADDKGTAAGAREAFGQLVHDGVSGIVAATSGSHLSAGLAEARRGNTPVLLPYADGGALPANAWLTGPSRSQVAASVHALLADRGWLQPFVAATPDSRIPGLQTTFAVRPGVPVRTEALLRAVRDAGVGAHPADVVVLALPAEEQARALQALQGAKVDLPVVLGHDAVSPAFAHALVHDGGSLSGDFTSVGVDAGDVTAVGSNAQADRAAGFFSAVRIAAGDSGARDLFGQRAFRAQAGSADIASHDAVVALVDAVARTGSRAPGKVLAALRGLHLGGSDGLAGPALDFSRQVAVPATDVVPLHATSQDPGVRPSGVGAAKQLFWFAVPSRSS